jgi:hypothetical protein
MAQSSTSSAIAQESADKAQIAQAIRDVFSSGYYSVEGKDPVRKIDVFPVSNPDLKQKWGVDIELNIRGSRSVMNEEMGKVYYAIFSNRKDIAISSVACYESLIDKYGNQSDVEIYKTFLKSNEAYKVNWSQNEDTLVYLVLPKVWTVGLNLSEKPGIMDK